MNAADLACPCCGAPFAGEHVPAAWLHLIVKGHVGESLVRALRRNVGEFIETDQLVSIVYGGRCLADAGNSIRVAAHDIRPRIEAAGWRIEGKPWHGYRLIPKGAAT